jgi:hypothetical protein
MHPLPQGHGRSLRLAGGLLALLALLAVVAFASRTGVSHHSATGPTPAYVSWATSVLLVLLAAATPFAVYVYVLQARERLERRGQKSFQARALRSLGGMFVAFGLIGLILYFRRHGDLGLGRFFGGGGGGSTRKGASDPTSAYHPSFQWPVLWFALVLAAVLAGWYVWWRTHREEAPVEDDVVPMEADLAASFSDAIDDLEAEPDARRAVIAAYARMEGAFARHGLRRVASETPTEYLRRILLGLTSQADAVRRLTGLFEQAKFSTHAIDGGMKQDAIDALRTIRDDLRAAPA